MDINRLEKHTPDYKSKAWKQYTISELGYWVHLFTKRATHRTNMVKAKKDLYDAKNYLVMMEQKVKNKAEKIGIDFDSL